MRTKYNLTKLKGHRNPYAKTLKGVRAKVAVQIAMDRLKDKDDKIISNRQMRKRRGL